MLARQLIANRSKQLQVRTMCLCFLTSKLFPSTGVLPCRSFFFHQWSLPLWSVRRTGTAQLLDFNIAVTLISFILSEKWLKS